MTDRAAVLAPAESRGRLDINDSVVETIARRAAATVSATRRVSGLSRITAGELPRARVTVHAGGVHATLVVGAQWPTPAAAVARRVQEAVSRQIHELTGLTVTRVDVEVHCTSSAENATSRRVQ